MSFFQPLIILGVKNIVFFFISFFVKLICSWLKMGGDGSFNCFTDRFGRCQNSTTHVKGGNPTFFKPTQNICRRERVQPWSATKTAISSVVTIGQDCRATPLVETHDTTVCMPFFSTSNRVYVLPSNFTYYFARFVNNTYSILNTCIGFEIRFKWPYSRPGFKYKNSITIAVSIIAFQMNYHCNYIYRDNYNIYNYNYWVISLA